ncbi:class I SAM-dependent methyltransferase [Pedobacter sp. BS3]|uniref:class I SAM-dependent methyltransferase n=1 Tax=Pedobacter sp. BS3 TaxID=2567937 RepID=UPI0011F01260|nr:class I SAM-dependent methyltransferase [Pedobacter sp. BS3]TZF83623.1 class I SAM-dependent methyltransferase [Pedobacter sp. BS3]
METDYSSKSSLEEIRERFDNDVERFSNLETGQQTTLDAVLSMELITDAAKYINPQATAVLDIGCGAGNYTLKLLSKIPNLNCTLIDLSLPMLERARQRVLEATWGTVETIQTDIREANLGDQQFDVVLAAAVLHHLRGDNDWELVFAKIYQALKPGGSFWISDLIIHDTPELDKLFTDRFATYLESLGGAEYRQKVFDYIEHEDTPRSVNYQLNLMKRAGFRHTEVLHKNGCFAAFGGVK